MIRAVLMSTIFAVTAPAMGLANGNSLPLMPSWQTDPESCSWHWREGGGIGLWAEACRFNDALWHVVWDENQTAFVTKRDETNMGIAVRSFTLPSGTSITALSETLVKAGDLDPEAACIWQSIAQRPAPRTMAFYILMPTDPAALKPTPSGEVPVPVCGPYGVSTHGLRYFITDLRWPDRAIFVEEGQERPLFEPATITAMQ